MRSFSNRAYDVLKAIALIWLPALGTLYFTIGDLWHLPFVTQVIGTITAADTFLGVVLRLSSQKYKPPSDGNLVVDQTDPNKDKFRLDITTPLGDLPSKDSITLKVTPGSI